MPNAHRKVLPHGPRSPYQQGNHGTRSCYQKGCRHPKCKRAEARYRQALRLAKAKGLPLRGQHVSAWPTRRRLSSLISDGFKKQDIAARLGLKRPILEWDHKTVTLATEQRLKDFYDAINAEGPDVPLFENFDNA